MELLTGQLERLGLEHSVLRSAGGGHVVVLTRGARVLGLFPGEGEPNALWVNPLLSDPAEAGEQFVRGREWNVGGDRTWLSPEIEYNIGDIRRLWETYRVPAALDPGSYRLASGPAGRVSVRQETTVTAHYSGKTVALSVEKAVEPAQDPLAAVRRRKGDGADGRGDDHDRGHDRGDASCTYAGYALQTTVALSEGDSGAAPLSQWHLMQIPAGGDIVIPTFGRADVHRFFGPERSETVDAREGMVRFRVQTGQSHKISLKAHQVAGRIGYVRELPEGKASLIVRHFHVDPSAEYGDVWADDPHDRGHCVQCYRDDGNLGAFGEMEFHTPLLAGTGGRTLTDRNWVWCYAGERPAIRRIADVLLGGGGEGYRASS